MSDSVSRLCGQLQLVCPGIMVVVLQLSLATATLNACALKVVLTSDLFCWTISYQANFKAVMNCLFVSRQS